MDLLGTAIASIIGFAGVLIGALISKRANSRQEEKRLMAEFYSEVFSSYTQFFLDVNIQTRMTLVMAIEKAKLVCSKKTDPILLELQYAVTEDLPDKSQCGKIIQRLAISSKEDVNKH